MKNKEILFVAENYEEVKKYVEEFERIGISVKFLKYGIPKPIVDNLQDILYQEAMKIYRRYNIPCLIWYKGLYIKNINLYVDLSLEYSGIQKLLKYLAHILDRRCLIKEHMVYFDGDICKNFLSVIPGMLTTYVNETIIKKKSSIDMIVKPYFYTSTFAELSEKEVSEIYSTMVPNVCKQFAYWYQNKDLE